MLSLLIALSLASFSSEEDRAWSQDDAIDLLAPYLGITPLDAEDLVRDALDAPERPKPKKRRGSGEGPLWAVLIPELHVSFEVNDLVTTGLSTDHLRWNQGVVFLVTATFGTARPPETPARPAGDVRLVSLEADVPTDPRCPTVTEVQQAAERASLVKLEDVAGWRSRARLSAWLPSFEADYRRNVGEIDTLGVSSNLGIDSHNLEDVTRYGVRASWQLGQIVFSSEELSAAQTTLEIQKRREELVAHVTELYFERLRLVVKLQRAAPSDDGPLLIGIAEVTAKIDALTDGFLSRRLAGEGTP